MKRRLALRAAVLALALAATLALGPATTAVSPLSAAAAECAGDDCQGPPPAPAEIVPGTAVVEGPPNPPVRFPKSHKPKKHHGKKHPHRQAHRGARS